MENYLQYMKTLRSQMNEVEDQAANISVEEQMHLTTIQNLEKDIDSVKNKTKQLKEETDRIMKEKGQICSMILEKQRKMSSLESDSSILTQTLDLMQKEKVTLSAKLEEKSTYYSKALEEATRQLKEQQDWVNANMHRPCIGKNTLAAQLENDIGNKADEIKVSPGKSTKNLIMKLDASKANFDRITSLKDGLVLQNGKMMHLVEQVKDKINNCEPELKEMDSKMLVKELEALLSDKAGVAEYLKSLQLQIMKIKEISHTVKCSCGEEYKVGIGPCA